MAAIGDRIFFEANVADNGYLDLQPAASHEANVYNIYFPGQVELYRKSSTVDFKFADVGMFPVLTGPGVFSLIMPVDNTKYLRVKNVSGGTMNIAADGVYTKVA